MTIKQIFKNDIKHNWVIFLIAGLILCTLTFITNTVAIATPYQTTTAIFGIINFAVFLANFAIIIYLLVNNWWRDAKEKTIEKVKEQKSYHYYRIGYFTLWMVIFSLIPFIVGLFTLPVSIAEAFYFEFFILEILLALHYYLFWLVFFYLAKYIFVYKFKVKVSMILLLVTLFFSIFISIFAMFLFFLLPTFFTLSVCFVIFIVINAIEFSSFSKENKKFPRLEIIIMVIVLLIGILSFAGWTFYIFMPIEEDYQYSERDKSIPYEESLTEETKYGTSTITVSETEGLFLTIEGEYNLLVTLIEGGYVIDITDPNSEQTINMQVGDPIYTDVAALYSMNVISDENVYVECSDTYPPSDIPIGEQINTILNDSCLSSKQKEKLKPMIEYALYTIINYEQGNYEF